MTKQIEHYKEALGLLQKAKSSTYAAAAIAKKLEEPDAQESLGRAIVNLDKAHGTFDLIILKSDYAKVAELKAGTCGAKGETK